MKSSSSVACKPTQPKAPHFNQMPMACLWTLIWLLCANDVLCDFAQPASPQIFVFGWYIWFFSQGVQVKLFSIVFSLTEDNIKIDQRFDSCQVTDRHFDC